MHGGTKLIVNAVHDDRDHTGNDNTVHAVHLGCMVKRQNGIYRSRTASMVAVHVAPARFGTYHSGRLASSSRIVNE